MTIRFIQQLQRDCSVQESVAQQGRGEWLHSEDGQKGDGEDGKKEGDGGDSISHFSSLDDDITRIEGTETFRHLKDDLLSTSSEKQFAFISFPISPCPISSQYLQFYPHFGNK